MKAWNDYGSHQIWPGGYCKQKYKATLNWYKVQQLEWPKKTLITLIVLKYKHLKERKEMDIEYMEREGSRVKAASWSEFMSSCSREMCSNKYPTNIQQIFNKYPTNIQQYPTNIKQISNKYPTNIHQISDKYPTNIRFLIRVYWQ